MEKVKAKRVCSEMLVILVWAFSITSVSVAAEGIWTRRADMPTPRMLLGTCVLDGKIYAIGGAPRPHVELSVVEVYDPATDTWTKKANMLAARAGLGASVVNGKIYAIGGAERSVGIMEEYDPVADTWTRKTDMPTARGFLTTSVVNGKIYAIGGSVRTDGPFFSTVEEYDPATDTWTARADMPTPRGALSITALNDRIYVIGGTVTLFNDVLSTVEEYYPNPLFVDFNGNGTVDMKDLLRLIESWGSDDPIVDIAPRPSGDGRVDAMDLELLMSYWEQPFDDPTLIAHWALDEAEGAVAYDSAGMNDAFVMGGTTWLPSSGQVDGALQLDGIDGCAVAGPVLNPADGPFSVLAWIQGGAPGQIVVSQQRAADWLMTNADGSLMTDLKATGHSGGPLLSQRIIIDGNWHRVGFVWDGLNRSLYVDDNLVAEDTQDGLESSNSGLYIGTGKNMEPGTYWSGLIDDIRIYNRVVSP